MTKLDLRRLARARRKQFVADRGSAQFPTHASHMAELFALLSPQICIAGYCAMPNEADISALLTQIESRGAALALPWIGEQGQDMLFRSWTGGAQLNIAADKFLQPPSTAKQIAPDIVLIPLLGFDRQGTRLGQGAGY
jgi:5-formyltetrahydrofolate cyclo-ligase